MQKRLAYPSDLTEQEWELIKHLVPEAKPGGRPEDYPKRQILNGIFYLVRSGCAWRMLPHDLPPWRIVYHDFRSWRRDGTWELINDLLRGDVRVAAGKQRQPSAGVIDRQSVKTTEKGGSTGMIPTKTSTGASAIALWTREACSSWWSSPRPACKTARAPCSCAPCSDTSSPACG